MANQTVITVTHGKETFQTAKDLLLKPSSKPRQAMVYFSRFFDAVSIGNRQAKVTAQVNSGDAVAASGTVTFASIAAADTVTVGTETFTASASPSGNNQFLVTGGDTAAASAFAAKVATHPNLSQYLTASAVGAVTTITATVSGRIGNNIPLAISLRGSVSGAHLANGADPTTVSATSTFRAGV